MDPNRARRLRIDQRASGMRRQRRVTQVTAAAAAAAAAAFGLVFAGALHPADQAPGSGGAQQQVDVQSGGS